MAFPTSNPYPSDRIEYTLWEHWHQAFFNEPMHAQLYEIESLLQKTLSDLRVSSRRISSPDVRSEIRVSLLKLEQHVALLDEVAEHAYSRVVTASSPDGDNRQE